MSIIGLGSVSAQSQNVKCTYAATHVISDAVKNIEDAHIRKMMIQKFQNDKKTFTMLYADGKYSFSEGSNGGDTGSLVKMIRILGGEPLLSDIIDYAVRAFEELKDIGYIEQINIVSNGTIQPSITLSLMWFILQYALEMRFMRKAMY